MKVVKVVHAHEVEQLTREGWALVFTHANAQRIESQKILKRSAGYHDGQPQWQPEQYEPFTAVLTDPLFVLEKDVDTVLREQQISERLGMCDTERIIALDKVKKLEAQIEMTKEVVAERDAALARANKAEADLRHARGASETRLIKLEADLAKVRKEIGEARWREVTGS